MWLAETEFRIRLGGNTYINVPVLIAYKGDPLFAVTRQEDGQIGIDFQVFNAKGKKVASVRRNNIYFGDKAFYQLDGDADSVTLKERASGAVLVDIKKRGKATPAELDISVRSYVPSGQLLDLGPDTSNLGGLQMRECVIQNCGVGIAMG